MVRTGLIPQCMSKPMPPEKSLRLRFACVPGSTTFAGRPSFTTSRLLLIDGQERAQRRARQVSARVYSISRDLSSTATASSSLGNGCSDSSS